MPGTLAGRRVLVVEDESDFAANLLTGYDVWTIPDGYRAVPHLTMPFVMANGGEAAGRMVGDG